MKISLVAICLIVMPWSVVLTSHLALLFTPGAPQYDTNDFTEIRSLTNALKIYRSRYGEYPPDFSTGDPKVEIAQHLQKAFPGRLEIDLPGDLTRLGPHNALYFWLQGFSSDRQRPLTGINRGTVPLYDFDLRRVIENKYSSRAGQAPFVYFRSDGYSMARCKVPGCGTAFPYRTAHSNSRFEEDPGFQIISAGIDGNFGSSQVGSESAIFTAHADNLTNFKFGPIGNASIENYRNRLIRTRFLGLLLAIACLAAYPCIALFRKRSQGVQELRKLVSRQGSAKPHTAHWRSILHAHHEKNKSDAIRRMSKR